MQCIPAWPIRKAGFISEPAFLSYRLFFTGQPFLLAKLLPRLNLRPLGEIPLLPTLWGTLWLFVLRTGETGSFSDFNYTKNRISGQSKNNLTAYHF